MKQINIKLNKNGYGGHNRFYFKIMNFSRKDIIFRQYINSCSCYSSTCSFRARRYDRWCNYTDYNGGTLSVISRYGYSAVMIAVSKKIMNKQHLSKQEMCSKIDGMLITKSLKQELNLKLIKSNI